MFADAKAIVSADAEADLDANAAAVAHDVARTSGLRRRLWLRIWRSGPDAAAMGGGAAAGALVLLLAAAGAFFFYRRNTAAKKSQDVEANANGVCDEAGGLKAPLPLKQPPSPPRSTSRRRRPRRGCLPGP